MAQNFYFAWVDAGVAFNPAVHNVEDENIFSFSLQQDEGDFASLTVVIKNPRIGLLNAGRKIWAWFSFDTGSEIKPVFFGRLLGLPDNIFDTLITLKFTARPRGYLTAKAALAETLKEFPYYDPIFIAPDSWKDPDVVLEGRTLLWHIDRLTHEVSTSDVLNPEDGIIEFAEDDVFYDSLQITLQSVPLRQVEMTATIPWQQSGAGHIELTYLLLQAFPGSTGSGGMISSFTFQGLSSSWPQAGAAIGDGWQVRTGSLKDQSFLAVGAITFDPVFNQNSIPQAVPIGSVVFPMKVSGEFHSGETAGFDLDLSIVVVPIGYGRPDLSVDYHAARDYAQVVHFILKTDIQPISTLIDDDSDILQLTLSANKVSDLTEDNSMPLGNVGRRTYLDLPRGRQSLEHLIAVARAHLIIRSRAVKIVYEIDLAQAFELDITLRKGALIHDPRLPGGQASGKLTSYTFSLDGDSGTPKASLTMGCAVGHGGAYSASAGDPIYVNVNYVDEPYQEHDNVVTLFDSGDVTYSLPPTSYFDDGLDLTGTLSATQSVKLLTFDNGPSEQRGAILASAGSYGDQAAITALLQTMPTTVSIKLLPMSGGPFTGIVEVGVSDLIIPKQIDLEAPSV